MDSEEEGQIQEIKAEKIVKKQMMNDEDEESQWSLESLEDLKGLNLNEIKDEEQLEHKQVKEEKQKIKVNYPPKISIFPSTNLFNIGKVIFTVGELYIIEASQQSDGQIVDLDNWVYDEDKNCIGFVIDVFGRVQNPFYAVKPEEKSEGVNLIGKVAYLPEGSKTLTEQDIKSLKAKSSALEQEVQSESSEEEREQFSVDFHKKRDNRRRRDSYDERDVHRSRTRNKNKMNRFNNNNTSEYRNRSRDERQQQPRPPINNQAYLQNMYSMYYNQMMQFYNGNGNLPMPPPPPYQ